MTSKTCQILSVAIAMLALSVPGTATASPHATQSALPQTVPAGTSPLQSDLTVVVNRSTPVAINRPFARIAISQPEIADASPTSDNRLYVRDETAAEIMQVAASYAPDAVIDALDVNSPQQVMLEVRFVEASREDVTELGIGSEVSRAGDFLFATGSGLLSGGAPQSILNILGGSGGVNIDFFLEALEERGVIRTLAEPNLVARSGETASFLAGGEFPVPVAADEDTISIQFREFGVSLEFTPRILSNNKMSLEVSPEVSQLDPRNSVRLANVEIPALSVRRANTIIELSDGESFAIAGLIQNTVDTTSVQTPWLGDVPVLGALFRSNRFRENETELVIIITPRIVLPAPAGTRISDPLTGTQMPSEAERILLGHLAPQPDTPPPSQAVIGAPVSAAPKSRPDLGYVPGTEGN